MVAVLPPSPSLPWLDDDDDDADVEGRVCLLRRSQ